MSVINADVIRAEYTEAGITGHIETKQTMYANDTKRMVHKWGDGSMSYWSRDGATGTINFDAVNNYTASATTTGFTGSTVKYVTAWGWGRLGSVYVYLSGWVSAGTTSVSVSIPWALNLDNTTMHHSSFARFINATTAYGGYCYINDTENRLYIQKVSGTLDSGNFVCDTNIIVRRSSIYITA